MTSFLTPGSGIGGTNFSNYTPVGTTANTSSASYAVALSVTGSGFVTGITQSSGAAPSGSSMRITVDGVVMFDGGFASASTTTGTVRGTLFALFPFRSSFLVEHSVNSGTCGTNIFYLLG